MKKKLNLSLIIFSVFILIPLAKISFEYLKDPVATNLGTRRIKFFKKFLPPIFYSDRECETCVLTDYEINYKKSLKNIDLGKMEDIKLENGMTLKRYNLIEGFYAGINNTYPGSGYLDFHGENLLVLSSRGLLGYTSKDKNFYKLYQIKNNINDYIGVEQFARKDAYFSLKDLKIIENNIYISYTEEIKNDCWNTSVLKGDMNYEEIKFKKLFSANECIRQRVGKKYFNGWQSGGRIVPFDDDNIILSIGDYRSRDLAQNTKSINGKLLRLNTESGKYQIISLGHRNPQGLLLDKENQFILKTEHGPKGGDEINLLPFSKINNNEIPNYGWPVASAGEHYGDKAKNKDLYKKYPLYKSHSKYGFVEPLISFVPSIGISEIAKIENKKYVVSSLKDNSIYFFNLNDENQITNLKRVNVGERIRDLIYDGEKLYLFLEDTATLGIIKLS